MQACCCAKLSLYTCSGMDTTMPTAAAFAYLCKMPCPAPFQLEIQGFDPDAFTPCQARPVNLKGPQQVTMKPSANRQASCNLAAAGIPNVSHKILDTKWYSKQLWPKLFPSKCFFQEFLLCQLSSRWHGPNSPS
ncbi:TPA: hypothetical protein ACH3X2_004043 [Trebouxia sp. C0005]